MQPNEKRLFRALAREGLSVTHEGSVYTVRLASDPDAPATEILLPSELPLEVKAVKQLAALAAVRHPDGGRVHRVIATPDFHPGDSGIAIGSVVATRGFPVADLAIPAAVGTDINCGMRLHITDLTLDGFLSRKSAFVEKMKGDYFLGTRDVGMTGSSMVSIFRDGLPEWAERQQRDSIGRMKGVDWKQVLAESSDRCFTDEEGRDFARVYCQGSFPGAACWAPPGLIPHTNEVVRDDGLATIGRGNHFVEMQVVDEIIDKSLAFQWGVGKGRVAFMVHSGSRNVGRYVGKLFAEKARAAWPAGAKHPESGIFPISWRNDPEDLWGVYLGAEATAVNYGFVNRALLAELLRLRLREVYGEDTEAPLVYDIPHNITLHEEHGKEHWLVSRKGACPAYAGQPVIIPGSMGAASYLCVGLGNERWLNSASHGAGRAVARGTMGRTVKDAAHATALGLDGVECITLRDERRVEESPAAYKAIGPVIDSQVAAGILRVVAKLKPVLTFKA